MSEATLSTDVQIETHSTSRSGRYENHDREGQLRKFGIYTPESLADSLRTDSKTPYLIEGLLRRPSVNLLVGDSGLGKTPLAIQIGVCIAAGLPVFGRAVQKGAVLYCDAESGKPEFWETLQTVSRFLGLRTPPSDFHVWSPNWEIELPVPESRWQRPWEPVRDRVDAVGPTFVVVDAFRTFGLRQRPKINRRPRHSEA
jgi:RecA-family ATPase